MDQQQQQLPVHHQQVVDMTTTTTPSLTPPAAVSAASNTPVVKPATPIVGASALNPMEEFVIGILSGIFGAFLSWFQLTGFQFVFYVILMPSLLLEIWESYVLFHKATTITSEIAYAVAHIQAVSRKRLARQLFGQGVIMGSAGFEIIQPDFDFNDAFYSLVTYYAIAWLIWIVICHFLNTIPPDDKIANQVKKQRALARAVTSKSKKSSSSNNNKHHHHHHHHHHHRHHRRSSTSTSSNKQRIRRSQSGSHASVSTILSRSSTSTSTSSNSTRRSLSSFRRSKSIDKTRVPIDLP